MGKVARIFVALALLAGVLQVGAAQAADDGIALSEFTVDNKAMCKVAREWRQELVAKHPAGTWAPLKFELTDRHLAELGLPSKDVLTARRYARPTLVTRDGRYYDVSTAELERAMQPSLPAAATYGGTGCLGIRPGAWLLLISGNSIGWCSMAHVYGSPGSYDISTAGHCGKTGQIATVIAAFGNRGGAAGPVLLDFGKFATSHDGGVGNDWALIDIASAYQGLVTPTMCVWGGPRGMYTKTGSVVGVQIPRRSWIPKVTVTPDPFLAQGIVHYGHGLGVGAGGTPRAGSAISWGNDHFMFFAAIAPGDSGSGANTITGDSVGSNMEAAGIITHLYIDPLMRAGVGIMAGTRATEVSGTLAPGQIVPYPAPVPIGP